MTIMDSITHCTHGPDVKQHHPLPNDHPIPAALNTVYQAASTGVFY